MFKIKEVCMLHKHFMCTLPNYYALDRNQKDEIHRGTIDYLFKIKMPATKFKNLLKSVSHTDKVIVAQRKIITKGCITKDLKLHLLQRCAGIKPINVGKSEKLFDILTDKQIKELTFLSKSSILSIKELNDLYLSVIENVRIYTKKFVRRKFTFLVKTGEHTFEEIEATLLLEGLQALMFTYPRFETELHATNIMRTAIKNIGHNYIETHTRLKRNRYGIDGMMRVDSFTGMDSDTGGTIEKTFADEDSNNRLFTKDTSENSQLESDIVDVTAKYSGRKAKIIHLLMGNYDEEFSNYLISRNTTKYTNDIYFEQAKPDRYIKLILNYLDYDIEKGLAFIDRLKRKLSDYQ